MSPTTSRRSCRMEKPFFSTATSPAKQGSANVASMKVAPNSKRNEVKRRIFPLLTTGGCRLLPQHCFNRRCNSALVVP